MQTIRDAAVLLGIIVLLTSVRIAPVEGLADVLPIGTAMAADGPDGYSADEAAEQAVPAVQIRSEREVEKTARPQRETRAHDRCSGSVIHVKTLDVDGQRVILRIDTTESAAQATVAPGRVTKTALKPCKIG